MSVVTEEPVVEESIALYRKYRPTKFSQVVGQDVAMEGLRKSVVSKNVLHAYMFSGERGCGKTTTARIFAAALNCDYAEAGEPCGVCDDCVSIHNGGHVGLVNEINSANARGIADMRALLENVNLGVGNHKYKIYILDEVHQLTADASNALLKTLEEPDNDHVIFILATTDPDKVLKTIRSRVMHIKFSLIPDETLNELAERINVAEKLELSESEIRNAVTAGHGSARDTISALERAKLGIGNQDSDVRDRVLQGVVDKNLSDVLVAIAEAGSDLDARSTAEDVMILYRDAMLYQQNPDIIGQKTSNDLAMIKELSTTTQIRLVKGFQVISQTLLSMKSSGNNRVILEGGLAGLMVPGARQQLDGVLDMLEDLTEQVGEIQDTLEKGVGVRTSEVFTPSSEESKSPDSDWPPAPQSETRPSSRRRSEPEPEAETPAAEKIEPEPTRDVTSEEPKVSKRIDPVEDDISEKKEPGRVADTDDPWASPPTDSWVNIHNGSNNVTENVDMEEQWNTIVETFKSRPKALLQGSTFRAEGDVIYIDSPRRIVDLIRTQIEGHFPDHRIEYSAPTED